MGEAAVMSVAWGGAGGFLLSLTVANLRLDAFCHYITLDAHFIHAFARAYEMAEDFAADDDRATIAALRKAILQELNLHAFVLKIIGIARRRAAI